MLLLAHLNISTADGVWLWWWGIKKKGLKTATMTTSTPSSSLRNRYRIVISVQTTWDFSVERVSSLSLSPFPMSLFTRLLEWDEGNPVGWKLKRRTRSFSTETHRHVPDEAAISLLQKDKSKDVASIYCWIERSLLNRENSKIDIIHQRAGANPSL